MLYFKRPVNDDLRDYHPSGELLTCKGLSELVRGCEATFRNKIEPNIRILAPEDTQLIDGTSSAYRASRLYLATLICQTPPLDEMVYLDQHAASDVMPFQFEPARQALQQRAALMLLCSDVASEGINLHHLSHRMVHFDIPWSLMVFQR